MGLTAKQLDDTFGSGSSPVKSITGFDATPGGVWKRRVVRVGPGGNVMQANASSSPV